MLFVESMAPMIEARHGAHEVVHKHCQVVGMGGVEAGERLNSGALHDDSTCAATRDNREITMNFCHVRKRRLQ